MVAVLGGLGAAAAWALSTLCSSRSSRLINPSSVVAWVMVVGLLIAGPAAAAHGVPAHLFSRSGAWLLLSGAGNVGGLLVGYAALRSGQVSLVAPLVSTEGAVAALIAVIAGEPLAPAVAATLAVIAAGVCLSAVPATPALAQREHATPESAEREHATRQAKAVPLAHSATVALAVAAAASFGVSLYATARAGALLPTSWVVLSARVIGVAVVAIPLALTRRLRLTRRAVPLVVVSGLCEVIGFYSYTAGARHGIAIAAVLGSQFAPLAAAAGYMLFGERLSRVQLAGVSTVVAGVALLSALTA